MILLVFQFYPVGNFGKFIKFELSTVRIKMIVSCGKALECGYLNV